MRRSLAFLALLVLSPAAARAQFAVGGVYIDSQGVLREAATLEQGERLKLLQAEAADGAPGEMRSKAALRKVSLRRLEREVQKLHEEGKPLPAEMRYLAGLTRLQHVFFYPESGDVVLAGPAEGWTQLPTGEIVGSSSKRPVLQLDDLIVALRYAFDPQPSAPFVGCSIEPTAEGMKRYAASMNGLVMDRSRVTQIFRGLEEAMGPQAVKVYGVEGSTRLAMKLVSADYRLKRIALAHDPSPAPEVVNYLDLQAKRLATGPQKQHRWWFIAKYDAIHHSADGTAFEFEGAGVAVETAPTSAGQPVSQTPTKKRAASSAKAPSPKTPADKASAGKTPEASAAARQFATLATKHFPALAQQVPVFAELQNIVGLMSAAELIYQHGEPGEAGADAEAKYEPSHFLDAKGCPVAVVPVPAQVPSLSNYRLVDNRHWLISISGGVEIRLEDVVGDEVRRESPGRKLSEARERHGSHAALSWWWD